MIRQVCIITVLLFAAESTISAQTSPQELADYLQSPVGRLNTKQFNQRHLLALAGRLRQLERDSASYGEVKVRIESLRKQKLPVGPPLVMGSSDPGDVGALSTGVPLEQIEIIEVFQVIDADNILAHIGVWDAIPSGDAPFKNLLYFKNSQTGLKSIICLEKKSHGFREGQLVPIVTWQGNSVCQVADLTFPRTVERGVYYIFEKLGDYTYTNLDGLENTIYRFRELSEPQWLAMIGEPQSNNDKRLHASSPSGHSAEKISRGTLERAALRVDDLQHAIAEAQQENDCLHASPSQLAENEYRTWSDSGGSFSAVAKYEGQDDGIVFLQRKDDGKRINVSLQRLSTEDVSYVMEFSPTVQAIEFPVISPDVLGGRLHTISFDLQQLQDDCEWLRELNQVYGPEIELLDSLLTEHEWKTTHGNIRGTVRCVFPGDSQGKVSRVLMLMRDVSGKDRVLELDQLRIEDRDRVLRFLDLHVFFGVAGYHGQLQEGGQIFDAYENSLVFDGPSRAQIFLQILAREEEETGFNSAVSLSPGSTSTAAQKEIDKQNADAEIGKAIYYREQFGAPIPMAARLIDLREIAVVYQSWLNKRPNESFTSNLKPFIQGVYEYPEFIDLCRSNDARQYFFSLMKRERSLDDETAIPVIVGDDLAQLGRIDLETANENSSSVARNSDPKMQAEFEQSFSAADNIHDQTAKGMQALWAERLEVPIKFTNSVGMDFVLIPPGQYTMGSSTEEIGERNSLINTQISRGDLRKVKIEMARSAFPPKRVSIGKAFYLCTHETRESDYRTVANDTRRESDKPVCVNWVDAERFCEDLSASERRKDGGKYRLPTEQEWEYACRAGTAGLYFFGDAREISNYVAPQLRQAQPVIGNRKPNPWGLFDMYGNVWEICSDMYSTGVPQAAQAEESGKQHVIRGGGWNDYSHVLYSASRGSIGVDASTNVGFRVLLEVPIAK